jgi:phosphatidylserine/phosphatidylglycerophosphate/cardiolipin synthase-like enzyme
VLAIDNTSRQNFGGYSKKLEQAVIKIILPGINSAQQSLALAMPVFFMDGDESYTSLQKVLTAMVQESFKSHVQVPNKDSEGKIFIILDLQQSLADSLCVSFI